jgi:hypothetical protein
VAKKESIQTMDKAVYNHDEIPKPDVVHREYLQDHDLGNGKESPADDAVQFAVLSEEELIVQKKLVRKIDALIMPLVILVYLMNYIDRCVLSLRSVYAQRTDRAKEQLCRCSDTGPRGGTEFD